MVEAQESRTPGLSFLTIGFIHRFGVILPTLHYRLEILTPYGHLPNFRSLAGSLLTIYPL